MTTLQSLLAFLGSLAANPAVDAEVAALATKYLPKLEALAAAEAAKFAPPWLVADVVALVNDLLLKHGVVVPPAGS